MLEPSFTIDGFEVMAINKNVTLGCVKNHTDPLTPVGAKAPRFEKIREKIPIYTIKDFHEVNLDNARLSFLFFYFFMQCVNHLISNENGIKRDSLL